MLTDEVLDEDIEALLYAQVYYGRTKDTDLTDTQQIDLNKEGTKQIEDSETQKESTCPEETGLNKNGEEKIQDNYFELQPPLDPDKSPGSSNNQSTLIPLENSEKLDIVSNNQNQNNIEVLQQQYLEVSTSTPFTDPSEKNPTQIVAQIPLATATGNSQQFLNNITINQYIYPSGEDFLNRLKSFREKIVWSKQCDKHLKRLQKGKINESDFFKILEKRLTFQNIKLQQQQHTIRKVFLKRQQRIASSDIICLSDSDNSDVEFVSVETTAKSVGNKQAVAMKAKVTISTIEDSAEEDDDEIIYVEPPPVPIINVEDESDSEAGEKNIVTESATQEVPPEKQPSQDHDDASNDFLAVTNTSDDFNFSLHGSEFHDAEFVKPAIPTDHYETETESTTSTSDFHRDSSRELRPSINTIVFNEVDFPREDIFDGSNMDKFSELITPNRVNIAGEKEDGNGEQGSSRSRKKAKPKTSSESSSESDYDTVESHKNLPDLTPMVRANDSPSTSNKTKTKSGENDKKIKEPGSNGKSSKKSKRGNFSEDNDGILDVEQSEKVMESRKSKRRRSGMPLDDDVPKKRAKKKKKKSGHTSTDERDGTQSSWIVTSTPKSSAPVSDDQDDITVTRSSKKKKKRARNADERQPNISEKDSANVEETAMTRSKRKEDQVEIVLAQSENDNREEKYKKKTKKRKSNKTAGEDAAGTSDQQNDISNVTFETEEEEENSKKKSKKRKQRIPTEDANNTADEEGNLEVTPQVISIEGHEGVASEDVDNQRKDKRKKRNSSEKRVNVEDKTRNVEKNKDRQETKGDEDVSEDILDILEDGELETDVTENVDEEDVILIEQAIPVHTIESSDSENEDLRASDILDDTLELANISTGANNDVTDEGGAQKADENTSGFDLQARLSKMSDDPEKWKILPADRYKPVSENKGRRCRKCRRFGHIERQCPNNPVTPTCTLCGREGHQEPRCPNKVCLNCAQPSSYSTIFCHKCSKKRHEKCSLCGLVGHLECICPDLWRRYHLTTTEGPLVRAPKRKRGFMPRKKRWCSGCAEKGHLEHECDSFKWIREYPVSSPFIIKYDDVYDTGKKATNSNTDLRTKLLENRSRNDTSIHGNSSNQHDPTVETTIDKTSNTTVEITLESLNPTSEITAASTETQNKTVAENEPKQDEPQNSGPSINAQPPQLENEENLVLNIEPPVNTDIVLESQMQRTYKRLSPPKEALYFPRRQEELQRVRSQKKKYGKAKLNPLSMLNRRAAGFTPYQSILNPCSMSGISTNAPPSLMDVPMPFIDNAGDPMLSNVPPEPALAPAALRLFNSVPANILAQQVANFMNNLPIPLQGMQHMNQGCAPDFTGNDFYQGSQYGSQIQANPTMFFDQPPPQNYMDYSAPLPDERYFDFNAPESNYVNRDFLNMPYTITSEPSPESFAQYSDTQPTNKNFRGGFRDDMNSIEPRPFNDFLSLSGGQQENLDTFPSAKLSNIEEVTAKKISHCSLELLVDFLNSELEKLDGIKNPDAKVYKKKLNTIDQLKKVQIKTNAIKKQIYFLYKHTNMFLFGIHKLGEGKRNLDFLRNFVINPGRHLSDKKRAALLESYGYIFGGEHPNFDYRKRLDILSCGQKRR